MQIIIYHETTPEYAEEILKNGFKVSYQKDYPHHAFFYIKNHNTTTSVNKGAKIAATVSEDVVKEYFIFQKGFASNDHVPLAIPFEVINKFIHTFEVINEGN